VKKRKKEKKERKEREKKRRKKRREKKNPPPSTSFALPMDLRMHTIESFEKRTNLGNQL